MIDGTTPFSPDEIIDVTSEFIVNVGAFDGEPVFTKIYNQGNRIFGSIGMIGSDEQYTNISLFLTAPTKYQSKNNRMFPASCIKLDGTSFSGVVSLKDTTFTLYYFVGGATCTRFQFNFEYEIV